MRCKASGSPTDPQTKAHYWCPHGRGWVLNECERCNAEMRRSRERTHENMHKNYGSVVRVKRTDATNMQGSLRNAGNMDFETDSLQSRHMAERFHQQHPEPGHYLLVGVKRNTCYVNCCEVHVEERCEPRPPTTYKIVTRP